jgi:hypothetical protein|tara:strand:- start:308 stop:472 length:165 start_codon:yes stop_codon:yes gene_type:complete
VHGSAWHAEDGKQKIPIMLRNTDSKLNSKSQGYIDSRKRIIRNIAIEAEKARPH